MNNEPMNHGARVGLIWFAAHGQRYGAEELITPLPCSNKRMIRTFGQPHVFWPPPPAGSELAAEIGFGPLTYADALACERLMAQLEPGGDIGFLIGANFEPGD